MNTPIRKLSSLVSSAVCLWLILAACNASALVLYWNPNGTASVGGNGTWDTSTLEWAGSSAQSATLLAWPASGTLGGSNCAPCFCAGPTGSASQGIFTVNVNSNINIAGIFDGPLNPGPCDITISGTGSLNLLAGLDAFDVFNSGLGFVRIYVPLTGPGVITCESSGQIFLMASNSYTGGTTFGYSGASFSGIMNYNNSNSFGTGGINITNTAGAICALVEDASVSGVVISNNWKITPAAGGLNIVGDTSPGAKFTGTWTLTSNFNIGAGGIGNFVIFSGVMSGNGALNKFNQSTLTLAAANTYAGNTSVSNGILQLGANGGIPSGSGKGSVSLINAGGSTNTLLDINGFSGSINGLSGNGTIDNTSQNQGTLTLGNNNVSSTFTGTIQSTGGQFNITKAGTGTFTLATPGGNLTYSGNTTVNAGSVVLGAGTTLPNTTALTVAAGSTLNLASNSQTIAALSGGGIITNNTGSITLGGGTNGTNFQSYSCFLGTIDQGSLTKQGLGVMSIHNTNLNNIAFSYQGGVLSVGAVSNALPTSFALTVPSGGLFQLDGSGQTISSLNGSGAINLGGGTLNVNATAGSFYTGTIQNSELITNSTATGHGLRGYYYDNIDFSQLDTVRDDAVVNFNFTNAPPLGLPVPPFPKTNFISIRWIGQVLTTVAGTYTFTVTSDDGQRLWVNGTNLVDNWISQGATAKSGSISLAANTRYDIVMEYMNINGGSSTKLAWTPPGDSVSTVIPTDYLFLPGAGNLVIGGNSQVTLTASNSFSGGTTVTSGGTLEGSADYVMGRGNVTINNGGVLTLDSGSANTYISSGADVVINSTTATLNLNYTGTDTIHGFSTNGGVTYAATGTYGSVGSGAAHKIPQIVGTGLLNVTATSVTGITLTSSGASIYGSSVTFTSTVSGSVGTPTGTITFYDGASAIGIATLSAGQATLTVSDLLATTSPHSITAVYSGDATYVKATSTAISQTVNPLTITPVTLAVSNKVYDGTANASLIISNLTVSGVLTNDSNNVHIASGTAVFSDKNIGTNKTVTITGLTLGGSLSGNYALTPNNGAATANISVIGLRVTNITVDTRPYDTTTTAPLNNSVAYLTNVFLGDAVTLTTNSASGIYSNASPGVGKAVAVLGYGISGNDASNYNLSQPTNLVGTITQASTTNVLVVAPASPSVGQNVTFTSTITAVAPGAGVPTGSVTFLTNGLLFNLVSLTNGVTAASSSNFLANASNVVVAAYGGDANYLASTTTNFFFVGNASPGLLTITKVGTNIVLNWSNSFTLQQATIVNNTNSGFADVPGPVTTGPYTNTNTASKLFFRLRN